MSDFLQSLSATADLLAGASPHVWPIVRLSIEVSGSATVLAAALALPLAAWLALTPFRGRDVVVAGLNSLMGLPSVVVGLVVYLLLSRAGPLGSLGILFSPPAMVVAQTVLVMPLITALARQTLEDALADTVVVTWALCSIPQPELALAEARRLLKPGGLLLFAEHGRAPDPEVRRWQDRINPVWTRFSGGCHLNRDVPTLIAEAGFELEGVEAGYLPGSRPFSINVLGAGRRGG